MNKKTHAATDPYTIHQNPYANPRPTLFPARDPLKEDAEIQIDDLTDSGDDADDNSGDDDTGGAGDIDDNGADDSKVE